jgi:deoxyadenosine/deoxycytidine kinase
LENLRYIVVEGVTGAGKSALATALARRLVGRLVTDAGSGNPFLRQFHRDRRGFAFSTQIFFLLARHRQQAELAQADLFAEVTVSDYLLARDRIFAYLNLSDAELALYEQLWKLLLREGGPRPDLVVYLQASPETLMSRLKARGALAESGLSAAGLEELNKAYNTFFFNYSDCPLLVVNTNDLDLDRDSAALEDLVDRALEHRQGTSIYTPIRRKR